MFSRLLLAPFVFGILYLLYQMWQTEVGFSVWLLPLVLIGVIIYLFSPQLDWWWLQRNPPQIHEKLRMLLQEHNAFYQKLSLGEKKRFRTRMALYMEAMEYRPMGGPETVPEDVRGFIAAAATQVSFGQTNFLMTPFEHIIIYPGAFPSPQFPEQFHNSEHFEDDGVLMFAVKAIMESTIHSPRAYHIGLHEYAQVFEKVFKQKTFPVLDESYWEVLEKISGMDKTFIHESIGLAEISIRPISIHHFFMFSNNFKTILPKIYSQYVDIFNLDPLEGHSPVVEDAIIDTV